jgi:hypothetical protein
MNKNPVFYRPYIAHIFGGISSVTLSELIHNLTGNLPKKAELTLLKIIGFPFEESNAFSTSF